MLEEIEASAAIEALIKSNRKAVYQQTIVWRGNEVTSGYYPSCRQSRIAAIRAAKKAGYTIPRWWQFWRWKDTNVLEWR